MKIYHPTEVREFPDKLKEVESVIVELNDKRDFNSLYAEFKDTHESLMIAYRRLMHLITKVNEATWKKEKHEARDRNI